MSVTSSALIAAIGRADRILLGAPVIEALLARRAAGRRNDDDAETSRLLIQELLTFQRDDGSFDGSVVQTAESLLLLGALQEPPAPDARCNKAVAWMLQQRNLPGRFGERCDPDTHQLRICAHYLSGFFSPGEPTSSLAGLVLSSGLELYTDSDARLAVSALALRACLCWSESSDRFSTLLDGLEKIAAIAFRPVYRSVVGSGAALEVLSALIAAPATDARVEIVQSALERLAELQRADGTWPWLEVHHVAHVLLRAVQSEYSSSATQGALNRAAELLVFTQHENGSWSDALDTQRTYIGWRALRQVLSERLISEA